MLFFILFQRAQPEIVTFLGYESDNALYSIPGKHIVKPVCFSLTISETVTCTEVDRMDKKLSIIHLFIYHHQHDLKITGNFGESAGL